jgi:hypothetical protein
MTQTSAASWIDLVFDALSLIFFLATLYLVWINAKNIKDARAGNTVVTALLAVFCALMGNPDRFQTIKFSPLTGIETEARKTIEQAQVTLAQLQNLGSVMGQFMIEADAARGRWGDAPSPAEHAALRERILGLLKSIDLPEQELSKVPASDRKWGIVDHVIGILHSAGSQVPQDKKDEWNSIYAQHTQGGVEKYVELTPDRLEELLEKFDVLNDHEKSLIADYRDYLKTGTEHHS